jgi:hypothetical protein
MHANAMRVVRLARFPAAENGDQLEFTPGVNLMVGEKDAGKTLWLTMLDFVLGNKDTPSKCLGDDIAGLYDTIELAIEIEGEPLLIRRSWAAGALRSKTFVNDTAYDSDEFSSFLLQKLNIPELHYAKGNPYADKAWPVLSFRTILRHMYRQERFWNDWADNQSETEQHACLALFLGLAQSLFSSKSTELVDKQKKLDQLIAAKDAQQSLLNEFSAEILQQKDISVGLTDDSIGNAIQRIQHEVESLDTEKQNLLEKLQEKIAQQFDGRMEGIKNAVSALRQQQSEIDAERRRTTSRLDELVPYSQILQGEIERFARARATSSVFDQLKVTHCPVCDQETDVQTDGTKCYLCHKPYVQADSKAAELRVDFEQTQLQEENRELEELISTLESHKSVLASRYLRLSEDIAKLEVDLLPGRQLAATVLPPDLALIDQRRGRLNEQLETLSRLKKSLEKQHTQIAEIDALGAVVSQLKAEISTEKARLNLETVGRLFEYRVNEYLNLINADDSTRWTHGAVMFTIEEKKFSVATQGGKLGATSKALLLFAYHYALLSLFQDRKFYYPGLVILDFPVQLADGKTFRDKENYLVEPFIQLCSLPQMQGTQFIAAGHAFDGIEGASLVAINRPSGKRPDVVQSDAL